MIRYRSFVLVAGAAALTLGLTSGCSTATPGGGGGDDPCAGVVCDDGDFCTVDSCSDGSCVFASVDCPEGETCSASTGQCGYPVPVCTPACEAGFECVDGTCLVPSDPCGGVNNQNNVPSREVCGACHDEVDFATGLNHAGGPQADDNACTACHAASGTGGIAPSFAEAHDWTIDSCDDGDDCTDDACVDGGCAFTATNVAAACDDGDPCNGTETCRASTGRCVAGDPLDCDDGVDCTDDGCDPDTGCTNAENCPAGTTCNETTGQCEDPMPCTGDGACRELPDCYDAGTSFTVTIEVTPPSRTFVYGVEDSPPSGWSVSSIGDDGEWDATNGVVKWFFLDDEQRTLTYTVTLPGSASGNRCFSGQVNFDGGVNQDMEGDQCVTLCGGG